MIGVGRGGGEVVIVGVVVLFAIISIAWHYSRSRSLLEQWAAENGYRILESSYRNFSRGPFFWTTSKGQTVYRVTIEDPDGHVRSGWVRCGSFFGGLISSRVEARWDDEA